MNGKQISKVYCYLIKILRNVQIKRVNSRESKKAFSNINMSRLLIGSSNIYRNYKAAIFSTFKEYAMVRCVDIKSFEAQMAALQPTETEVIISVIENFIETAVTSAEMEKKRTELEQIVVQYFTTIEIAAKKNPGSKFVLVEPIRRPKIGWYEDCLDELKQRHKEGIRSMGVVNVFGVDVICRASQQFEKDGFHLTKNSGAIFVECTLDAAEAVFRSSFVDLSTEPDEEDNRAGDRPAAAEALSVVERLDRLEFSVEERRWNDNLMFARTREELDTATNKTKEDRIIMTGLTSSTPPPHDKAQRSQWIRQVVIDTLKRIKPDFNGKIGFVNQGKNNGREIPMVEVKMGSIEDAANIRRAFAEKRKEGDGKSLGRLYVANSVTLSTRVRIDVMKAIARKLSTGTEAAHVSAFSSRPILHVKNLNDQTTRAYTFIDAVIKYRSALRKGDLDEAYRRAGSAFRGQVEQHFVVLHESGVERVEPSGGNRANKRPREEVQSTSGYKKSKK
jgi:hypothetical protein